MEIQLIDYDLMTTKDIEKLTNMLSAFFDIDFKIKLTPRVITLMGGS